MSEDFKGVGRLLLVLATAGLFAAVVCAVGWYRTARSSVGIDDLSSEKRQALVEALITLSPGVFESAWYHPPVGYTLKRDQQITAWNDTFTSNELGYRTGSVSKASSTFRVVFVGDSWTYGMGVRQAESFPEVFARLANQTARREYTIEAWSLALPGYNTLNEAAALWFFFERLQPDAVVFCPTRNDNHSLSAVLPNGSLARSGVTHDRFGENHAVTYIPRILDSFRYRSRWRMCFEAIRETKRRLDRLQVPMLLYFAATWDEALVHRLMMESGSDTPYVITPKPLAAPKWRNPKPLGHATPAANEIYGRMVYQGLAETVGWPLLPRGEKGTDVRLFRSPPASGDWTRESDRLMREATGKHIPESFFPSKDARTQCAGPLDEWNGLMARSTTILVRRRERAAFLRIKVRRMSGYPSLYPLSLTVTIPSPAATSTTTVTVPSGGEDGFAFNAPIPPDIAPGAALDVNFAAERVAAAGEILFARSLYIASIEQSETR